MPWMEIVGTIAQGLFALIVTVLSPYIVTWITTATQTAAAQQESTLYTKYVNMASKAVTDAVLYTSQTYVDALKASDQWSKENQKQAFTKALLLAKGMLSAEAVEFIESLYGDITEYLTTQIEAEVKAQKD